MKDSIAYLPKDKQEDLNFLVNEIQKRLPRRSLLFCMVAMQEEIMYAVAYGLKMAVFLPSKYPIMISM